MLSRLYGRAINFFRLTNRMAKANGLSQFAVVVDVLKKRRLYRLRLTEYYNYEFDKYGAEYADTFLSWQMKKKYLEQLNPDRYFITARNKYLAHCIFSSVGIKAAELYLYYEPTLIINNDNYAYDSDGVKIILRKKNVTSCVIKKTEGFHGDGVVVVKNITYEGNDCILFRHDGKRILLDEILSGEPLLFEALIVQTSQINSFNPSSVNTVRFMTVAYPDRRVEIIAAFIKIGRSGACIDNAGAGGNVDAAIDVQTGMIYNAIQFDGFRKIKDIECHPDSNVQLNGTIIKEWDKIKLEVIKYQQSLPFLKAAGWDIALTEDGPVVIEVNDFWDETGQLFLRKGWKKEIESCYLQWTKYWTL